jgi:hypothetical protein
MDIPRTLDAGHGHMNFGVYLVAKTGGALALGDRMRLPD